MASTGNDTRPLAGRSAWIFTTGAAGMDAQTRGVADALGLDYEMKRVAPQGHLQAAGAVGAGVAVGALRRSRGRSSRRPGRTSPSALGRSCVPYMRALRRRSPKTFSIVMLDNRAGLGVADVIWVPQHDRLRGPNVITTLTAPHSFTRRASRRAAPHGAARHRRAAAPAHRGHSRRQEQGLRIPRRGRRALRRRAAVARRAGRQLHDHAVAAHACAPAGGDRARRRAIFRASCGTARAPIRTATSSPMPTRSSSPPTAST